MWYPPRYGEPYSNDIEIILQAEGLRVCNEQRLGLSLTEEVINDFKRFWEKHKNNPLAARNKILQSICPNICGLFMVKLATMLTLIGGVPTVTKSGLKIRGESHMLLIGEPGTGKSHFLKYATVLTPRAVLTTGIGSTSAGLTVSAVKEQGGEWVLEAGALVLADCGVCCIDEFSSIRERDRATIHEAMEQQTLSVAKAGLVCTLQTRTTVIAATNPKGKFDPQQSISINTNIASPLLSRFDIIMLLMDEKDVEWDTKISRHILEEQLVPSAHTESTWNIELLRAYIATVKTLNPTLTDESKEILIEYYKKQRRADQQGNARTTIRLLESLIRISQAHARLMMRNRVSIQDAVVAVILMESSFSTTGGLTTSVLHSVAPDDPEKEYRQAESIVLHQLGLEKFLKTRYISG